PVTAGSIVVPYGHVIGNEKWRGSEVAQKLQGKVRLIFEDGLGLVDFHLSNKTCILLISEADLVAGDEFKRRLVRFRNASSLRGIVIVEKTQISDQYYSGVQKFIVLELGMVLLPVANQGEAAQLIVQLLSSSLRRCGSRPGPGSSAGSALSSPSLSTDALRALRSSPAVGRAKALLLLRRFGSVRRLCNAPLGELQQVLGLAVAQQVYAF
ncbi:FAP24 protein, partial [Donacobius atricapilla]|nr:FAP24 protein [Donacobius atricapilla]